MLFFFFNDTATTEIYTLSLHDALPISDGRAHPREFSPTPAARSRHPADRRLRPPAGQRRRGLAGDHGRGHCVGRRLADRRTEKHTSEIQSRPPLLSPLLLLKKKIYTKT